MSYTPKIGELVLIEFPSGTSEHQMPKVALNAGKATLENKQDYMKRVLELISHNGEIEQSSIQTFLANPDIYVCLYNEQVGLVDAKFIVGPYKQQEEEA